MGMHESPLETRSAALPHIDIPPPAVFGIATHPKFLPPPASPTSSELHKDVILTNEVLGVGSQAVVLRGIWRPTQSPVAIKVIFKDQLLTGSTATQLPMEIKILSENQHPNLIQYVTHYEDYLFYYLILELAGPVLAWSEVFPDYAWNTELPECGFGKADALLSPCVEKKFNLSHCPQEPEPIKKYARARSHLFQNQWEELNDMNGLVQKMAQVDMQKELEQIKSLDLDANLKLHRVQDHLVHHTQITLPGDLKQTSRDLFECLEQFGPFCEDRYVKRGFVFNL
jgi:hypothetical protein